MLLRRLWAESRIGYLGTLPTILGSGQDLTLHYGGVSGKPPFLYVPFPMAPVRRILRKISKCNIIPPRYGEPGKVDCSKRAYSQSKIAHVGEAHCTIEAYKMPNAIAHLKKRANTESDLEALVASGLFDKNGNGIPFPLKIESSPSGGPNFMIVSSIAYADEHDNQDTSLPVVVAVRVKAPRWEKVHQILGTRAYPTLPGGNTYQPHITLGYMHDRGMGQDPEESPADIRKQVRRSYQQGD